ncbi:protein translocase subunit SecF [Aliidiomarina quisquiliarum]|uniref:protein translocase subunit SecF n=1 Tax=Aliidiomarina quisquiliarum TaxID=2938947 RepID=UPI00208E66F5|nr:protein translocase subunit SecF [Aliidiomarina quisquiliarum]MCO4322681.1 protein translocase subunit SecF [Aliidiomarina quisquiliarum]
MNFFEITKMDENSPVKFMDYRKHTTWLSIILAVIALSSLVVNKLNWGLDFTGGTLVEVSFSQPADLTQMRTVLGANNFDDAVVQSYGTQEDVLVRIPPREGAELESIGETLLQLLQQEIDPAMEIRRVEFVGPQVGDELAEAGALAILVAMLCILAYVSFRFEWRLALSAVAGLFQDVLMILGVFSLLQIQIDLTILAALLAVVGYSLNDSIVVADRIRENFRLLRKEDAVSVFNISISQTMSRTLITSLTTLIVLVTLFFFGGQMIRGFSIAMMIGVVVGTYSSVFTRSTLALALGVSRESLMPPEIEKEGEEQDVLL